MKFTSKNQNYHSPQANRGVFINPFVASTGSTIDTENERLTVDFALQYEENGVVQTLERMSLQFNKLGKETLIQDANGDSVELIAFLTAGGTYDVTKIVGWGTPSFASVQSYFTLESVWSDLTFLEQPLKQVAIDYVMNVLNVEGLLLKEKFELETI